MAGADWLDVELAYRDWSEALRVPVGTTVRGLIERARLLERCPELDLSGQVTGIFSKPVALDALLQAGDRVEIYRPLLADPKERRRRKVRG